MSFGGEGGGLQSGVDEPHVITAKTQQVEPPESGRSGSKKSIQSIPSVSRDARDAALELLFEFLT
jgi:hypothetical protein